MEKLKSGDRAHVADDIREDDISNSEGTRDHVTFGHGICNDDTHLGDAVQSHRHEQQLLAAFWACKVGVRTIMSVDWIVAERIAKVTGGIQRGFWPDH
jgi:hypothetical protein